MISSAYVVTNNNYLGRFRKIPVPFKIDKKPLSSKILKNYLKPLKKLKINSPFS